MFTIYVKKEAPVLLKPTTPVAPFDIALAPVELVAPRYPMQFVFCWRGKVLPHDALRASLSKVLVHYATLSGKVAPGDRGSLHVSSSEEGIKYVVASTEQRIEGDAYPACLDGDFVTTPGPTETVVFQVTHTGCGSTVLAMSMCHNFADATAAFGFITDWGRVHRGLDVGPVLHDRSLLRPSQGLVNLKYSHPEYKLQPAPTPPPVPMTVRTNKDSKAEAAVEPAVVPPKEEKVDTKESKDAKEHQSSSSAAAAESKHKHAPAPAPTFAVETVHWSKAELEAMRQAASEGEHKVSVNSALAAHLWQLMTVARQWPDPATRTKFGMAVNGRQRLEISDRAFLCSVFYTTAEQSVGELVNNSLAQNARIVHQTVQGMTPEYLRSATDFIESQPNYLCVQPAFSMFGADVSFTSWAHQPVYPDFGHGAGQPTYVGIAGNVKFSGLCVFLNTAANDGSIDLLFGLRTDEMQRLKADPRFKRFQPKTQ